MCVCAGETIFRLLFTCVLFFSSSSSFSCRGVPDEKLTGNTYSYSTPHQTSDGISYCASIAVMIQDLTNHIQLDLILIKSPNRDLTIGLIWRTEIYNEANVSWTMWIPFLDHYWVLTLTAMPDFSLICYICFELQAFGVYSIVDRPHSECFSIWDAAHDNSHKDGRKVLIRAGSRERISNR